jgi:hypothetical protein
LADEALADLFDAWGIAWVIRAKANGLARVAGVVRLNPAITLPKLTAT